jgi:transposase
MLTWPPSVRVFVHTGPTDMRRSFDTLAAMVREILKQDPLSGHLFVFFNRPRDRAKMLLWDRTGYWLFYRRLESGVFRLPGASGLPVEMTATELSLILEGIDLSQAERRKRFSLPAWTA